MDHFSVKILLKPPRLLLAGIGNRLIYTVLVLMALWAGYFWAITTPMTL